MTDGEYAAQLAAGAFAVVSYGATIRSSVVEGRSILPYFLLIGLHVFVVRWLLREGQNRGGGDAAGNGLHNGLVWLAWIVSGVGFGCVTWGVLFAARLFRGSGPT